MLAQMSLNQKMIFHGIRKNRIHAPFNARLYDAIVSLSKSIIIKKFIFVLEKQISIDYK